MKATAKQLPVVLTIAGSDSGGGAGIQADLKTFAALDVFGTSAVTCVTAQNPSQVSRIYSIDARMVAEQIMAVCAGFPVAAAKTGMLYCEAIIRAVAQCVNQYRLSQLVVDPVMMSTSRAQLLRPDSVSVLCWELMTRATVVTPNLVEAEVLFGKPIPSVEAAKEAARDIAERFKTACVVKGGHLKAGQESGAGKKKSDKGAKNVVDVLYWKGKIREFKCPRVDTSETHGTGCMFSAALTAFLAKGKTLDKAVEEAQKHVHHALKNSVSVGKHHALGW
jgi:hydroxymethylpyrimidine/phosphomethylpyrimidine kinase